MILLTMLAMVCESNGNKIVEQTTTTKNTHAYTHTYIHTNQKKKKTSTTTGREEKK